MTPEKIEEIAIQLVIEALRLRHSYDLSGYDNGHVKRRLINCLTACNISSILDIIPHILYNDEFLQKFIGNISIPVTTMFRDPEVFLALREQVVPHLYSWPFINVWSAGCATGEETYSLAILLKEANLYDQVRIYATDINPRALETAVQGIYPGDKFAEFEKNYQMSGGKWSFLQYCTLKNSQIRMLPDLRKNIIFSTHNLADDGVFVEANLILCRNVMIYFESPLQHRVMGLFHESLVRGGFLCVGSHETPEFLTRADHFSTISSPLRIVKKSKPLKV